MADTEELLSRLQRLEDGYYGDKEAARKKSFFDKHGSKWSNNEGLGMAILNELDARNVDTSAADEAVQSILDQLRTECQEIIDMISNVQETAIENAKKIETISDVVSEKVASNPEAGNTEGLTSIPPIPNNASIESMSSEGEFIPPPPAEGEVPPPPAEGEVPPPPAEGEVPPPPAEGENFEVSDERLKQIKSLYNSRRARRR